MPAGSMVSPIPARAPSERAKPRARGEARAAVAEERSGAALDFIYGHARQRRKYATRAAPLNAKGGSHRRRRADTVGAGREAGPPFLLSPVSLASGLVRAREGGPVMSVYVGIDVHRKRS